MIANAPTPSADGAAPSYPRWVVRAPGIGAVLCLDADEERRLLAAFAAESAPPKPASAPDIALDAAPAPKPPKPSKGK